MGRTILLGPNHTLNYFAEIFARPTKSAQAVVYVQELADDDCIHNMSGFFPSLEGRKPDM
jgi:hypothetical protein